jgi:hypothetical protein
MQNSEKNSPATITRVTAVHRLPASLDRTVLELSPREFASVDECLSFGQR